MPMSDDTQKESTYPFCRCVDPSKGVCLYCEDTLDGDSQSQGEGHEESTDTIDDTLNVLP